MSSDCSEPQRGAAAPGQVLFVELSEGAHGATAESLPAPVPTPEALAADMVAKHHV